MNNNSNNQQLQSNPKGKAVASSVLGIISVIPAIWATINQIEPVFNYANINNYWLTIFFLTILASIIGLISGIKGLGSTKKSWLFWG